jgi:MFS family permease
MILLLLGQTLLAISALGSFWFACIARFFVGLGGKNISVSRTTYSSDWFMGRELAFSLSLAVGVSRSGAISVMAISPKIYEWTKSIAFTFWFGDIFVLLSTICGLIAILIDQYVIAKSRYKRAAKKPKEIKLADLKHLGIGYWLIAITTGTWYMSFNCFIYISTKYAEDRFGLSYASAGYLAVYA